MYTPVLHVAGVSFEKVLRIYFKNWSMYYIVTGSKENNTPLESIFGGFTPFLIGWGRARPFRREYMLSV
jgi:hypothetical protein